jgi:hypothetical protein
MKTKRRWATMTTKLKRRVERLERDLPARRRAEKSAGLLPDYDEEEYSRLWDELYGTIPEVFRDILRKELSQMHRREDALMIAAREDRFRLRPPRAALAPRAHLSRLTLSFIGRLERALHGDRRPLALPKKVCDVYFWAEQYKRDDIPVRECESCGYDTPAPPARSPMVVLDVLSGTSHTIESYLTFTINRCPVCGDALAPPGHRPWSDSNPDKVVDVHMWPDGEISIIS